LAEIGCHWITLERRLRFFIEPRDFLLHGFFSTQIGFKTNMSGSGQTDEGRKVSLDEVLPQVYGELHRLASVYMRNEREGHTLQPTALGNEAYLRLIGQYSVDFSNRAHLLGVAAQMMRRILQTHEEKRRAEKRGGEFTIISLADSPEKAASTAIAFSDVDEVLDRLAALDKRQAQVAELRIFGGLTLDETAEFLGVSTPTVHRDWVSGRLWLARELRPSKS
jgi:RNA polymerase sigma factor (TIGR02999 family)